MSWNQTGAGGVAFKGGTTMQKVYNAFQGSHTATLETEVGRWENIWGSTTPIRVFHVVLDTDLGSANERLRMYVDGALATPVTTPSVAQGDYMNVGNFAPAVVVGNIPSGGRSIFGTIYYLALYDEAMPATVVADHAAILAQKNDGPDVP